MPQLPAYSSKGTLAKDQPEVIRSGAGDVANTVAKAAGQVGEIAQKWLVTNRTIQYTTGKAAYEVKAAEIEAEASLDPNPANAKIYADKYNKLKTSITTNIQDAVVKKQLSFELDHSNQLAGIKLDTAFKKKAIEVGKVSALTLIEIEKSKYINASNEQEKLNAAQEIKGIIDTQVSQGIFEPVQGNTLYNDSIKECQTALKDRESLRRVKEKELAFANEVAINENESNYIKMKVTGIDKLGTPISKEDLIAGVRKDLELGTVSPEFTDRYIRALTSPKAIGAKTIDKDFADIISEINSGKKSPERLKTMMLNALSDGYLSENDFAAATTYFDMMSNKQPEDLVAMNTRKSWMGIEVFSENTTAKEESRSRMSRSFISKLQSGIDAKDASIEAMREEVLYLHPEVIGKPEGSIYIDDSGRTKKILPNGDIVEIQSTTKDTRLKEKK